MVLLKQATSDTPRLKSKLRARGRLPAKEATVTAVEATVSGSEANVPLFSLLRPPSPPTWRAAADLAGATSTAGATSATCAT